MYNVLKKKVNGGEEDEFDHPCSLPTQVGWGRFSLVHTKDINSKI